DQTGRNTRVTACLHCGSVSVVESCVDEPRAGDIRLYGHIVLDLPEAQFAWLAAWPRRAGADGGDWLFLPAGWRRETLEELEGDKRSEWERQGRMRPAQRFRLWPWPQEPAPGRLPLHLREYDTIWRVLQFTRETPVETVLRYADPRFSTAPFALDLIADRPDRDELLAGWLRGNSDDSRRIAHALLQMLDPLPPELLEVVVDDLAHTPLARSSESSHRLELHHRIGLSLDLLSALRPDLQQVAPALTDLKQRIGKRDYELMQSIGKLLAALPAKVP
ncbi:MAG TPA: hypothetical protein VL285_17650, partial [Bryobacteraceae bacterium]|nr:hypothetical protein [Bryobacteraceae bacterium]